MKISSIYPTSIRQGRACRLLNPPLKSDSSVVDILKKANSEEEP